MTIWEEEAVIGNPGYRQYRYRVVWKGDTVVRMLAVGEPAKTGYSDFDSRRVEVFYGKEGPGPLYRREHMLTTAEVKPSPLHLDDTPG